MPPRGVKSPKRKRQYEKIKQSARKRGASTPRAKELAARTVNKARGVEGETKTARAGGKTRKTAASAARTVRKTATGKSAPSRSKTASGARKTGVRKTGVRKTGVRKTASTRARAPSASRAKR